MSNPLLIFLAPFSFLIALFFDSIIKTRLSLFFITIAISICLLLVSPFVLTKYTYGDLYSNVIVVSTVSTIVNFIWMRFVKRKIKLTISVGLCVLTFIPTFFMYFGRAFVGEPTIYDSQSVKNYRVKYLQESSPGIKDSPKVELYNTKVFGLLQKLVDIEYVGEGSTCDILLKDSMNAVYLIYNTCDQRIRKR